MRTPSYTGSIRVVAALGRFSKEFGASERATADCKAFLGKVSVVQAKAVEGEEPPTEIPLTAVLNGNVKARIRVGGSFGSVSKVAAELEYRMSEIHEHELVMNDCKKNLQRLLGGADAHKALVSRVRRDHPNSERSV